MPYDEKLADRIREALASQKKIEEKVMFRGMCFMVNDKMCICINPDEILVRVGPEEYETALERNGTRPMIQNGRTAVGFVFVSPEGYKGKKDFDYWVNAALAFNKLAKPSKKKAKTQTPKKKAKTQTPKKNAKTETPKKKAKPAIKKAPAKRAPTRKSS
jgi:TfoX/Sxy family transcriptional regulator of competence genes